MLVLARKNGESIIIGGNIRVTVVAMTGNVVRLGIAAPSDVSVNREEIEKLVDREGKKRVA